MAINRLREASPDRVFENPQYVDVGNLNNTRYRNLISIDLKGYEKLNIKSATLSLCWYYPIGKTRKEDTVIEVYRPASTWDPGYVSWNKKNKGVAWTNPGGDWYDKNGILQGSTPYATLTIKGSTLPDNRYYELDVTDLVKEYVSGKSVNTGLLIKARTENNDYIAFYSSETNAPKIDVRAERESSVYIMVLCESQQDAINLSEDLKAHIGGRVMEIYSMV